MDIAPSRAKPVSYANSSFILWYFLGGTATVTLGERRRRPL
jgi:hypothetical protein